MGRKKTTQEYIQEAQSIHGNRYDYSQVEYSTAHEKIKIGCSIHGIFEASAYSHVNRKSGCPHCAKRARKTTEQFIKEATEIHNGFYSYNKSAYINISTKLLITCPKHGDFDQTPRAHLVGKQGCPVCGGHKVIVTGLQKRNTTETFINNARKIHGWKYDYTKSVYQTTRTKLTITCPEHGDFEQSPNAHVSASHGCPSCWEIVRKSLPHGGYSAIRFQNNIELAKTPGVFYVVEYQGGNEHFYKIGITRRDAKTRLSRANKMGMKVKILQEHYMSLIDAFTLEQRLLETLKDYKYWPNKRIGGFTECFNPKPEVLTTIQEALDK